MNTIKPLLATPENMEKARIQVGERIAVQGLFAYSETTGERYSASPGDYWNLPYDKPLLDSMGNPMILATEHVEMRPYRRGLPMPVLDSARCAKCVKG